MLNTRPDRKCATPGCGNIGNYAGKGGHCPDHSKSDYPRQKAHGLRDKWWLKFIRTHDQYNGICQRVGPCPGEPRHGVRCGKPVYYHHHLIEVESRTDLRLDQRNVVGVCRVDHPTPQARDQGKYVPTLWRNAGEPIPDIVCMPGVNVPKGITLWHVAERLVALAVRAEVATPPVAPPAPPVLPSLQADIDRVRVLLRASEAELSDDTIIKALREQPREAVMNYLQGLLRSRA